MSGARRLVWRAGLATRAQAAWRRQSRHMPQIIKGRWRCVGALAHDSAAAARLHLARARLPAVPCVGRPGALFPVQQTGAAGDDGIGGAAARVCHPRRHLTTYALLARPATAPILRIPTASHTHHAIHTRAQAWHDPSARRRAEACQGTVAQHRCWSTAVRTPRVRRTRPARGAQLWCRYTSRGN